MAYPDSTWACGGYMLRQEISRDLQRDTGEAIIEWFLESFSHEYQQEERKHFRSDNFKFAGATWNLFISLDRKKFYSLFGINIRGRRSSDMFFKCESDIAFYSKSSFKPVKKLHCNFECRDADSYGLVEIFFSDSEMKVFLNQSYLIYCKIKVLKSSSRAVAAHTPTVLNDVYGLSQDMKSLLLSERDSDVTIQVRDQQFKAHWLVLMARSSVFAAMFHHNSKERATGVVNVEDCDPSSFPVLLEFIYAASIEKLSTEKLFSVYKSADKFDVQGLKRRCLLFIMLNLSVDTFCETVRLSFQHSEADLLKIVVDFFAKNFKKIISKPEWQAFSLENPDQVNEIFSKAFPSDTGDN